MKAVLVKSLNNEEEGTGPLLSQNGLYSARIVFHPSELLDERTPWKWPNNTDCCQDNRLLITKWHQNSIAEENTHTINWMWKGIAGAYLEPSPLLSSLYDTGRYHAHYQRRKVNTSPATNPAIYNICRHDSGPKLVEGNQPRPDLI